MYGPTPDGSHELLIGWPHPLKIKACPERNLSKSRNIGINIAAGDIIAFLDDDAIPEPEWLDELVAAYCDPSVGGAGGIVYDHTGAAYQYRFGTMDRLGRANLGWHRATPEYNFPYSANFPHLLGANSSFRRTALLSIGGFDEEYEYYLDETDVQCRLLDKGWRISQLNGAFVHHKLMPSSIRNERRILQLWYPVVKNKIYYGLMNGLGHHGVPDVIVEAQRFIEQLRLDMEWAIGAGHLDASVRARFTREIEQAWADGLRRGLSGERRVPAHDQTAAAPRAFIPFFSGSPPPEKRCTFCLLSQEYSPAAIGGVGPYIHQLARGLADLGHKVHVLTRGSGHDSVDLEDGVWVHRMIMQLPNVLPPTTAAGPIPAHIWAYSSTALCELLKIAERREITCVYAPIWDCEGAAIFHDGRFPLVVGLQTTLKLWLMSNQHRLADASFKADFVNPMLALELELLKEAPALHAISLSISEEIAQTYDLPLQDRIKVVPLGLDDFAALPSLEPKSSPGVDVRMLFVGRLEARKGIDVLLGVLPQILSKFPTVQIDIVGNDNIPDSAGTTYRRVFEASTISDDVRRRTIFHGEVEGPHLRGLYRACDIFVAPSHSSSSDSFSSRR